MIFFLEKNIPIYFYPTATNMVSKYAKFFWNGSRSLLIYLGFGD